MQSLKDTKYFLLPAFTYSFTTLPEEKPLEKIFSTDYGNGFSNETLKLLSSLRLSGCRPYLDIKNCYFYNHKFMVLIQNEMTSKSVAFSISLILLLIILPIAHGQKKLPDAREIDQKFSQVWKTSEASRKNYSWKVRTEVTRDNKVMQILVEAVSFDPIGKQTRKIISNQETPLPSTFLIHQVAEGQKSKIIAFMNDLSVFLEKYALTDDSTRHSFFSTANIGAPDAKGQFLISGSDVFARGDKLKWWIDTRSYTITYASISTTFKGTSAEFSATYYLLPGFNYMAQAKIRVPSKNMVITLKFYDFVKR